MGGKVGPREPRWTPDEDARLATLYGAGGDAAGIAPQIGRSPAAVAARIVRLRIARRPRPRPWLASDEAALVRMRAVENLTVRAIASRLGRTKAAVSNRIVALKLGRQKRRRGELAQRVRYWHGKGLTDPEIADRLSLRSTTAVHKVRVRLKLPPNITPQERARLAGLAAGVSRRNRAARESQSQHPCAPAGDTARPLPPRSPS